jgi:serine O-acetyltransferase
VQDILEACVADIQAVRDRDPACFSFVMAALYFKGFQALQCYRVAHWMWRSNRRVPMQRWHRR